MLNCGARVSPAHFQKLAPGGRFYRTEPNRWRLYRLLGGAGAGREIVGDRGFYPKWLAAVCRRQGLEVESIAPMTLEVEPVSWRSRLQRVIGRIPVSCFQSWFLRVAAR